MALTLSKLSLVLVLVGLLLLRGLLRRTRSRLPLPPGPRKLPLVGNLFNHPSAFEWKTYMQWSKIYDSNILHLDIAGKSIVILSSVKAAVDLLEKRSAEYSDRARMPMLNELAGWDFHLAFMRYGDRWRTHRRLIHNVLHEEATCKFQPKEIAGTHKLLRQMLQDPNNWMAHLRHMAGDLTMHVAYGIDVLPENDPYVQLAEQAVYGMQQAAVPGRFLVNSLPILKYVPEWFPGAGFRRLAKEWKILAQEMIARPFVEAKRRVASSSGVPHSFTSSALRTLEDSPLEDQAFLEEAIKGTAGAMYAAGSDTTVSALSTFILAMLANPEAQKKSQAEIDSLLKQERLPEWDDEPLLPYVSALVKEVLRWQPVVPIGVPHFVRVEDEYGGYRIPAGSIVIANAWAMLHDEVTYPNPYSFNPERFLLDGKLNPSVQPPDAAFGFGRRICPGRHLAISSVWITVASILATFEITKAVGEDGAPIEPSYEYVSALISMPVPFKCCIKPRSKEAEELIRGTLEAEMYY